jgi:hypothetical protein
MSTTADTAAPTPTPMREVLRITTMRRLWYAEIIPIFGDLLALFAVIAALTFKRLCRVRCDARAAGPGRKALHGAQGPLTVTCILLGHCLQIL